MDKRKKKQKKNTVSEIEKVRYNIFGEPINVNPNYVNPPVDYDELGIPTDEDGEPIGWD